MTHPRRRHGEGSLYRTGGRWIAAVSLGMVGGKRRRKYFTGATAGEARDARRAWQQARGDLLDPRADQLTLSDVLEPWGAEYRQTLKAESTWAPSYEPKVRLYIVPRLGSIRLAVLSSALVLQAFEGLTPNTRRVCIRLVRSAVAYAVDRGWLLRNPIASLRAPRLARTPIRREWWTGDQIRAFLTATQDDEMHPLWVVLAKGGLRVSEALGLTRFDLKGNVLMVREQRARRGKGTTDLKTLASHRSFPVDEELVAALQAAPGETLLFPWTRRAVYGRLATAIRKAGLPRLDVHGLRHSCATHLLKSGVHSYVVAQRLGHSEAMLLQTYAHADAEEQAAAAAVAFGSANEQPTVAPPHALHNTYRNGS